MEKPDVTALAQKMIEAVRAHVSRAVGAVVTRLDELEQRVDGLPAPEKGEDGSSVTMDDVLPELTALIDKAVAAIPKPKDGDHGTSVTIDDVAPLITEQVRKAIEAFPLPKDGKDVDPAKVFTLVAETVAAIPKPQDGKSVSLEEIVPLVEKAVAAIPKPKDGASIHPDTVALMVAEQISKAVASIPRAKDGDPGRDALSIDILPGIQESKSYPRGTFAEYRGGVIRAIRNTDPITDGLDKAGWTVAMNGIYIEAEETLDEGRTSKRTTVYTNGRSYVRETKTSVILDRGVWREGQYAKGDHCSWDGSGWIAQRDTADKPGTSDAWRLSTKRGRDGKSADQDPPPRSDPIRLR